MAERTRKPFLTAEWRHLAMLNYAIDPQILRPLVPSGTELDFHDGQTFVSIVGFLFLRTRVLGVAIPLHRNFEEVNLRFYVRRNTREGWRRGVTFVRELVPRRAIATVARVFYDEPYLAVPMQHSLAHGPTEVALQYQWWREDRWETLAMRGGGAAQASAAGSHEEFITEHYWGYTKRDGGTSEYGVEHERWLLRQATEWTFDADVASLYGPQFVETLRGDATSAFIAEGSPVLVRHGARLAW